MKNATMAGLAFALVSTSLLTASLAMPGPARIDIDSPAPTVDQLQALTEFEAMRPGSAIMKRNDRITRVYGRSFSRGTSAKDSAERFLAQHVEMLGVRRGELMERGPFPDGRHVQPIMFDLDTQTYKFTGLYYAQHLEGVPVFRSRMMLLVRNEAEFPLVLASTDLRPLAGFQFDAVSLRRADDRAGTIASIAAQQRLGQAAQLESAEVVIWAGIEDEPAEPRLAVSVIAEAGTIVDPDTYAKMLYVVDAETGAILYEENQVVHGGLSGNVSCQALIETGADICHPSELIPMAYARVTSGSTVVFADENGDFDIPVDNGDAVISRIWGRYFRVFNQAGTDAAIVRLASPPNSLNFVHNEDDNSELARAEVNAYVHSNIVRDFTLKYNPDYPVIANQLEFTVNVNLNNSCNAFYNGTSINFYTSGSGCTNTAAGTVVYHEYGHHLVNTGGSGQGQYGEGMSDAIAVLITENPVLGTGFNSNCSAGIRNASNNHQYPCSGTIHFCGQLISGCVWDTLLELQATHPSNYLDIIAGLTINSILLHTGTSIDPSITIDFLTLDDDDDDIFNGTPHYMQIQAGFSAHNMPGPDLDPLSFTFPNGLPETLSTATPTTFPISVTGLAGQPAENPQVMMHYRLSGEFTYTSVPLQSIGENLYEAAFPAMPCPEVARFYFTAMTETGMTATHPRNAPQDAYLRYAGTLNLVFEDQFDTDLGWTVGAPDDDATSGFWERANPVGTSTAAGQAQPNGSFVGSACYITGQHPGGGAGANDVDNGKTTLFSPVFNLEDAADAVVSYWRWYSNHAGASPYNDVFIVDMTNDGVTWARVETIGPAGPQVEGGWYRHEFALSHHLPLTNHVQFRFIASDYNPQALVEAAVDAFSINVVDCTIVCPADLNGDGVVDVTDLLQLFGAWGPCSGCVEDITGTGVVDVSDLLALFGAWGACPN